ncbi:MAG: hypothetical protein ACLUNO_05315 [Oscillospiraceae bacterium]
MRAAAPARAQRAGAGGLRRRAAGDGRGAADRHRADERRPAAAAPRGAEQHGRGENRTCARSSRRSNRRGADAAAKRTALEQTHFGVQTPDEAGETAERDAQRAEALAGTAEHGGKPYFWIAALVLAALCAVLGYLVAQPLYYAAIALAAAGCSCC